jgi:peroxiredoxin
MIKVKTFTNELKALHAMHELHELDDQVNRFIQEKGVEKVISVSDSCTTGAGNTIGIIRVLTYESA